LRELVGKPFYEPVLPSQDYLDARRDFEAAFSEKSGTSTGSLCGTRLWEIIQRGLLPRMQYPQTDWEQYYSAYVQTYLERDVRQLAHVGDELQFRQFLISMAARTGELLNYSSISRDIGIAVDTVRRWTSVLRASGIVEIIPPYHNNVISRAVKTPKLYFMDTGLVCYLTGWMTPDVLQRGAKAGNIFETFVVSEIIKSWRNAGKDTNRLFFYRDRQGNGIDLMLVENGVAHPIEIKMTASPHLFMTKAFRYLDALPELTRGLGALICQRGAPLFLSENVVSLPLSFV
jgi:predicted AAA+ superfamily ATPase